MFCPVPPDKMSQKEEEQGMQRGGIRLSVSQSASQINQSVYQPVRKKGLGES